MSTADRHQQAPTPVRLPDDLKAALKSNATSNDRSLNGEVVARLRDSFQPDGMTLRDYFAAKALPGILAMVALGRHDPVSLEGESPEEKLAGDAYRMADAMLKARAA